MLIQKNIILFKKMQEPVMHSEKHLSNSLETSPAKSDSTLESGQDSTVIYLPIPVFVFVPFSNNFLPTSFSEQYEQTEPKDPSSIRSSKVSNVKLQNDTEINIINKSTQYQKEIIQTQLKREYTQNQHRNVMPNLIRLVLNFLSIKEKSEKYLKHIFPEISSQNVSKYYQYAQRFKSNGNMRKKSYISEHRFKNILGLTDPQYFGNRSIRPRSDNEELYKSIMRSLSMFYLTHLCEDVIINSPKMKEELKNIHLSKRTRLISVLQGRQESLDIFETQI